jgi:O-antigen ligase
MGGAARFSVVWFSIAVVLTTASQLRLPGVPIGPGEGMLLVWILLGLSLLVLRNSVRFPTAAKPFLYFWAASIPLLLAGWLAKELLQIPGSSSLVLHDAFALVFSAAAIGLFVLQPQLPAKAFLSAKVLVVTAVVPLAVLLVLGYAGIGLGPLEVWYLGISSRFQGWATNPNQTALLMAPIPFVAGMLLSRAPARAERIWWAGIVAASVVIGIATLSDSVFVVWAMGGPAWLLVRWYGSATAGAHGYLRKGIVAVVLPVLAAAVIANFVVPAYEVVGGLSRSYQGALRFMIWANGVEAIGTSPIVGLGPGPHSGETRPFSGLEVHNTFIDWPTRTGLLGMLAYIGLLLWVAIRAWRAKQYLLLLALMSVVVFGAFHFVLRQPVFWLYLVIVAFARTERPRGFLPAAPPVGPVHGTESGHGSV